jgi:hypothetical protein
MDTLEKLEIELDMLLEEIEDINAEIYKEMKALEEFESQMKNEFE